MNREQIAKTALKQIGSMLLASIGAAFKVSLAAQPGLLGGVMFYCSLYGNRGCNVTVALLPVDLYRVTVIDLNGVMIADINDVSAENLPEVIETAVESHFNGTEPNPGLSQVSQLN